MRKTAGRVLMVALLWGVAVHPAQLPPEILADKYLVEAEQLIVKKEFGKALELMNKIVELQQQHNFTVPAVFHYKYAEVALVGGLIQGGDRISEQVFAKRWQRRRILSGGARVVGPG